MVPRLGEGWREAALKRFLGDQLTPQTFSVVSGIATLLKEHEFGIGCLLMVFSVAFPVLKLALVFIILNHERRDHAPLVHCLAHAGKWSMLDVLVVAIMVLCFKTFPGGTRIEMNWGAYAFAASVLLSMLAVFCLKRHLSSGEQSGCYTGA